jgi:hypothetical protein
MDLMSCFHVPLDDNSYTSQIFDCATNTNPEASMVSIFFMAACKYRKRHPGHLTSSALMGGKLHQPAGKQPRKGDVTLHRRWRLAVGNISLIRPDKVLMTATARQDQRLTT